MGDALRGAHPPGEPHHELVVAAIYIGVGGSSCCRRDVGLLGSVVAPRCPGIEELLLLGFHPALRLDVTAQRRQSRVSNSAGVL